jgi:hypothetical protein
MGALFEPHTNRIQKAAVGFGMINIMDQSDYYVSARKCMYALDLAVSSVGIGRFVVPWRLSHESH